MLRIRLGRGCNEKWGFNVARTVLLINTPLQWGVLAGDGAGETVLTVSDPPNESATIVEGTSRMPLATTTGETVKMVPASLRGRHLTEVRC